MKKFFTSLLFFMISTGLFSSCAQKDSPIEPFFLYQSVWGQQEEIVLDTFSIDDDRWRREESDGTIDYQTEDGAVLAGRSAWMQLQFTETGGLTTIACSVTADDFSKQEIAKAIRELYDGCTELFGEPGYPDTKYPDVQLDWTAYGEGTELINQLPISKNGICSIWSVWDGDPQQNPNMMVEISVQCMPPDNWTGHGMLNITIQQDISRELM